MITLAEQHTLANNGAFKNLIQQAAATIALEIMVEDPATLGGGNDEYIQRSQLARNVISNAPAAALRASYILATAMPSTDPAAVSDAQYLGFLRTNWSALAGYNPLYVPDVP